MRQKLWVKNVARFSIGVRLEIKCVHVFKFLRAECETKKWDMSEVCLILYWQRAYCMRWSRLETKHNQDQVCSTHFFSYKHHRGPKITNQAQARNRREKRTTQLALTLHVKPTDNTHTYTASSVLYHFARHASRIDFRDAPPLSHTDQINRNNI